MPGVLNKLSVCILSAPCWVTLFVALKANPTYGTSESRRSD